MGDCLPQWAVGDQCQTVWSKDGKVYGATIVSPDGDQCRVKFDCHQNEEDMPLSALKDPEVIPKTPRVHSLTNVTLHDLNILFLELFCGCVFVRSGSPGLDAELCTLSTVWFIQLWSCGSEVSTARFDSTTTTTKRRCTWAACWPSMNSTDLGKP